MSNALSTQYTGLRRWLLALEHRLRALPRAVRTCALTAPVVLLVSVYYTSLWRSVASFVAAVDHCGWLFEDFLSYYYPMGSTILGASRPIHGYFYSAFFAILLVPVGAMDTTTAMWTWGAIQALALLLLFAIPLMSLLRLSPLGIALYTAVLGTSFPLLHNTKWGQVSVLLTACVVGAFHAYKKDRRILAGVVLAFAAAIKYYPAVFFLYFVLKRDVRVCVSFAVAAVVFYVVLPVAVMGPQSWLTFETAGAASLCGGGWISADVNSQFFPHVVTRWFQLASDLQPPLPPVAAGTLAAIGYATFLGNAALLWTLQRSKVSGECVLSLVLLFLSLPLVVKTSWPHYFSYLPFCQVAILAHLLSDRRGAGGWRRGLLVLPLFSIACSSVFAFDAFPRWQVYNGLGMLFVANLLLLVCIYLVVLLKALGQQSGAPPKTAELPVAKQVPPAQGGVGRAEGTLVSLNDVHPKASSPA